jgi:hypothetical protein
MLPYQTVVYPNGSNTAINCNTHLPGVRILPKETGTHTIYMGVKETPMGTTNAANQMTYYGKLLEPGMTFECDMSEYSARYSPTHILGLHNEYIGEPITSYMRVSTTAGDGV